MKRRALVLFIFLFLLLFILAGCAKRYKKISFGDDTNLGEMLTQYINRDTRVEYCAEQAFPDTLPMYKISQRMITDAEYQETLELLGINEKNLSDKQWIKFDGNKLQIELDDILSNSRGYFDMTEEELERKAREVFSKLPFVHGEYEYIGMRASYKRTDSEGEHILSAAGCFCRVVNGIRVVGHDSCYLYFDGSGLISLVTELYDYKEIGSMKVIPLPLAIERITSPDDFSVEEESVQIGVAKTLKVEKAVIRYVNQLSQGCEILEPVYAFRGTAFDSEDNKAVFTSIVIAIPASYTE